MIKCFNSNRFGSNTYLYWNESNNFGVIIDCGNPSYEVARFAKEQSIHVEYIILTHGHHDHAYHIYEYIAAFPDALVLCHESEMAVLEDAEANASLLFGETSEYSTEDIVPLTDGDHIPLEFCREISKEKDGACLRVIHTPGHTQGSICLYNEDEEIMFTGDTLFRSGYGRTDLKTGNHAIMQKTLRSLLSMPEHIHFFSGHGAPSKIGLEKLW